MAEERKRQGGKKNRKHGRNRISSDKCGPAPKRYIAQNRRFKNKLRRVEQYNGEVAAKAYQMKYGGQSYQSKSLVKRKG